MRSLLSQLRRSKFIIRISSWEYWPFHLFYLPVYLYWAWLCIKSRSLLFFSASNPNIENGGMLGESKIKILNTIPASHLPRTKFYSHPYDIQKTINEIESGYDYPLIAKPDIGERGWGVVKIINREQLYSYLLGTNVNIIIQEYLELPLELGVFYHRYPDCEIGKVTSIVEKEMLSVIGDGRSTIEELILKTPRAVLQHKRMKHNIGKDMQKVLPDGVTYELEPIGNHSRGTQFLNANHRINKALTASIDKVARQIPNFYFGRFDVRCESYESLESGKFMVMELNGAGSEPAHIYQPGTPLLSAYKAIFYHLAILQRISVANHRRGVRYMSLGAGYKEWRKLVRYNRMKTTIEF